MEITTHSVEETKKLAEKIAQSIGPGSVIALYGELGAGKTTFSRYLTAALGSNSRVQSPTFVLVRKYSNTGTIENIHHLDLYRLKNKEELKDIDLAQFISDKTGVTIIEWPELAEEYLPQNSIKIRFEHVDENERKIYVENIH